jgi:divalent metal cation (Fe/Co/Zn/Cd) transporter
MDAVDPDLIDEVEHVLGHVEGVERIDSVRVRWIGHELHGEVDLVADAALPLAEAHRIALAAEQELVEQIPRLSAVTIHVDPSGDGHH